MTDEEFELFLTLKFNGVDDIIEHFKTAIKVPPHSNHSGADTNATSKALSHWADAGAPDNYEIPPEQAETFLIMRFGSVDKAWDYVMSRPPGEGHGLSEHEINVVMNYVKPGTT